MPHRHPEGLVDRYVVVDLVWKMCLSTVAWTLFLVLPVCLLLLRPRFFYFLPLLQSGIESAVAELKAALARDPEGFTKDAKAKEILDRLNDEIARVYGEGDDEGSEYDDEDEEDDEEGSYYSDEEGDEYDDEGDAGADDGGRGSESGSKDRGEAKTELPKGPRPYDLWRAAHEIERPAKEVRRLLQAARSAAWLHHTFSWSSVLSHTLSRSSIGASAVLPLSVFLSSSCSICVCSSACSLQCCSAWC